MTGWDIGRPQPALSALIDRIRSDVLDAGCGDGALSLDLASRGYTVVGFDNRPAAIQAAKESASRLGSTATFVEADAATFGGYDGRFSTILDSGLLHSLDPQRRQDYLGSIYRAAAPGAALFILGFVFPERDQPGPWGFTESTLYSTVAQAWSVDDVRPAPIYVKWQAGVAAAGHGFLLSAHKPPVPVASAADGVADRAEDVEDRADQQQDDSQRPQDVDAEDEAQDQ